MISEKFTKKIKRKNNTVLFKNKDLIIHFILFLFIYIWDKQGDNLKFVKLCGLFKL